MIYLGHSIDFCTPDESQAASLNLVRDALHKEVRMPIYNPLSAFSWGRGGPHPLAMEKCARSIMDINEFALLHRSAGAVFHYPSHNTVGVPQEIYAATKAAIPVLLVCPFYRSSVALIGLCSGAVSPFVVVDTVEQLLEHIINKHPSVVPWLQAVLREGEWE